MNDNDSITDGSFNISLPETEISQTIPKLLRHAMKYLKAEVCESRIYIPELHLDRPYTSGDTSSLYVEYWIISDDQQELHDGNIEYRKELRAAVPTEKVVHRPSKEKASELRMIEYRLPQLRLNQDSPACPIVAIRCVLSQENVYKRKQGHYTETKHYCEGK